MNTVIISITAQSLPLARQLRAELGASAIVTPAPLEGETDCTCIASLASYLSETFAKTDAYVFIGALGICVRSIAPYLADKHTDPAVVCVDSTARFVIPVLSGHVGGANDLASRVAATLGAEAVITTQSDRTGLWALDTLGSRFDWDTQVLNTTLNRVISLFVGGAHTLLYIEARVPGTDFLERTRPAHVDIRYGRFADIDLGGYELVLTLTPFRYDTGDKPTLCFIPQMLYAGIGLARMAGPTDQVLGEVQAALEANRLWPQAVREWGTICEKCDEPVVAALRERKPVRFFTADELSQVEVPTPSPVVAQHMGTPSVSEAAARLLAEGGPLVVSKQKGTNYTVAVAVRRGTLLPCGHIEIVGAGPGDPDLVSVRGRQMLEKADLILYAGSLVPRELTLCAKPGATVRSSASMNLEEQFALMKEFYDRGQFVVRLHTGDPCIYGAIQEQMNYFDRYGMSYHITPGISSFQAAAAALRSQFTIPEKVQSIILTRGEGRTPMPEREKLHLLAQSQSTMCIFLSAGIVEQVQAELLQAYPPTTPVAVCYHLTWKDERIFRGNLGELAKLVRDNHLTLTTLIVVGDAIDNREGLSRLYADEFKHLYRH